MAEPKTAGYPTIEGEMKKAEIRVGGLYLAKVSAVVTTVRVDAIRTGNAINRDCTYYDVTNLRTGYKTTFRSAAKFRCEASKKIPNRDAQTDGANDMIEQSDMERATFNTKVQEAIETAPPEECPYCQTPEEHRQHLFELAGGVGDIDAPQESCDEAIEAAVAKHDAEDKQRSDPTNRATAIAVHTATASLAGKIAANRSEGTRRQVGTPVAGMVPNDEQESILAVAIELQERNQCGQVLAINAGAGTGKTSTDRMLEQVLYGTGQYTAFNKPLVEEAKTKFVKASVNTTYALAFRAVGRAYQHRLGADRVKSWRVAQMLGMSGLTITVRGKGQPLERGSGEWNNYILKHDYIPPYDGVTGSMSSPEGAALFRATEENPDDEQARLVYADWLEENGRTDYANFVRSPHGDLVRTFSIDFLAGQVREAIRRFCQSADPVADILDHVYSNVISPLGNEAKRQFKEYLTPFVRKMWADVCKTDGELPFDHICYVKIWQLAINGQPPVIAADYILLDEAQDTPPVFLDILKQQKHALLILVGDDNQQIYEFLGAVNAMSSFKGAPRRLLSQSYRFGQAIADVANSVLATLDSPTDLVMRGNPALPSRVAPVAEPRCFLYRTNAGAVSCVMIAFAEGKRPHLIGGGEDTVKWCRAALDLQHGKKTSHPDLCCFDSWGEVEEYSKTDEGADLKLMVKIVNQFGADNVIRALHNMPKEADADLVVSTAHKSKGREWDTVKLGQDFPNAHNMSDGDCRILYVALTRAKLTLDISECPPFCGAREFEADPNSRWIPGLRINYTQTQPSEEEQATLLTESTRPAAPTTPHAAVPAPIRPVPQPSAPVPAPIATGPGNGKYTWAKQDGAWMARGPAGTTIGSKITVERRDGSAQIVTVKRVVQKYNDTWIYEV